jgi:hypothetical protein
MVSKVALHHKYFASAAPQLGRKRFNFRAPFTYAHCNCGIGDAGDVAADGAADTLAHSGHKYTHDL